MKMCYDCSSNCVAKVKWFERARGLTIYGKKYCSRDYIIETMFCLTGPSTNKCAIAVTLILMTVLVKQNKNKAKQNKTKKNNKKSGVNFSRVKLLV